MATEHDFTARHVLVTGASQGIGSAVATAFAAAGARVSLVARRRAELEALRDAIGGAAQGHRALPCDLTDFDQAATLAEGLGDDPVDVVVHAVGGSLASRDVFAAAEEWDRVWRLNVGSVVAVNNVLVPAMVARGRGRVVMLSSRAAVALDGGPAYCAAKAALNAYITTLGRSLAGSGVVATGLMLGAIAAPGNAWDRAQRDNPSAVAAFLDKTMPNGRLGTVDDVVPFVMFLASQHNAYGNGAIVPLDGGMR